MAEGKDEKRGSGMQRLKWETARDLGLADDLQNPGDELTVREAGKIGGNMVRKLIKKGKKALAAGETGGESGGQNKGNA